MSPVTPGPVHREVRLARRPAAGLTTGDLDIVEAPRPEPGAGRLLVRNRLMSVTAVMRSLMRESAVTSDELPMPGYETGEPLWGPALGEVVEAPAAAGGPDVPKIGDLVEHRYGWREYAAMDPAEARPVATEGPEALPDPAAYLSQGFTAWTGVVHGAEVRPGDTVFVSGAAGGVGSLAGQFARLRGASRVIGSTGSPRKADILTRELGYDTVVLRESGTSIEEQLREAAPDGIDAVLDNVGGEQLSAALAVARHGARVCVLGSLSAQVSGGLSAALTLDSFSLLSKALTLRGIRSYDHMDQLPLWRREFAEGLRSGELTVPHARLRGIQSAPRALCELLEGRHLGAVLVEM